MTRISIIIPVYNVENYIEACLISVSRQDLKDIEIIAVNDGSTDRSAAIIKKIAAFDSRILLINKNNEGVTSARETGLKHANGAYVFYLDGDDRLGSTDSLSIMLKRAEEQNADFVSGDFRIVFSNGKSYVRKFPGYDLMNSEETLRYAFLNNDFYYTGRLIRKEHAVSLIGIIPKDITYGEDTYAVVNLLSIINKSTKVNEVILDYIQRETSVTNRLEKRDQEKRNKATNLTLEYIEKQNINRFAAAEVTLYALREIYQSIIMGCPNYFVAKHFLPKYKSLKIEYKSHLSRKARLVLGIAAIDFPLACKLINCVKKIK